MQNIIVITIPQSENFYVLYPVRFFALMASRVLTSAMAMLPPGRELDEMFARLPLN